MRPYFIIVVSIWTGVLVDSRAYGARKKVMIEHLSGCDIKGNLGRKKSKIYHLPGSRSYRRTKINKKGERWFCSEKQAQEAGWRAAGKFKRPIRNKKDCALPKGKLASDPLIKGNISSKGKMYHVPCSGLYEETLIIEKEGERWFRTEEEARQAGWFKAGKLWTGFSGQNFADCIVPPNAPVGRTIKGNISRNGRIYHVLGSRYYGETSITVKTGERWFATSEEAIEAGWRAPRNAKPILKGFCNTETLAQLKMRGAILDGAGK